MLNSIVNKRKINEDEIKTENHMDDECTESASSSSKICRLGKCEVCAQNEAKYTCPRCEVKTCCLNCVNVHKKELECNGIRDRTKYIPLRKMTNMDFMSDYYFLEECARFTRNRQHDPLKRITRYNKSLPINLFRLRNAANERQTKLRFLLQNFTRHKQNTTYFDWKLHRIFWRVEWIFVDANNAKFVDERCDEDLTLLELLNKYVNPTSTESVAKKDLLACYQLTEEPFRILLKAECVKRSGSRFYALDKSKTLRENLAKKTLVEYPIIYVICGQHLKFDIIDDEEKVELETKSYEAVLQQMQTNQRKAAWKAKKNTNKNESEEEDDDQSKQKVGKLLNSDEIINQTNNFLFSDERLIEALSTDDDGAETEEEK